MLKVYTCILNCGFYHSLSAETSFFSICFYYATFRLCTIDYPKFIVPNQKEESISIQMVNNEFASLGWLKFTAKKRTECVLI